MKKNKILLVCALTLGLPSAVSNLMHNVEPIVARAEEESGTATYTITSPSTINGVNTPSNSTCTFVNTYKQNKEQLTKNNSATLIINNENQYLITSLKLKMKSNQSSGSGKLMFKNEQLHDYEYLIGNKDSGVSFNKWYTAYSTKYVDVSIDISKMSSKLFTSSFELKIESTANSLYIQSYEIGWELNNYHNVILNSDENNLFESISVKEGKELDLSDYIPEKDGYIFEGWIDSDGKKCTSVTMGTSDVTLTASWSKDTRKDITVTFKMNDGTDDNYNDVLTIKENETIESPTENPIRDGYKFTGWYTTSEATTTFDFNTKITDNLVLYAGWEETNIVTDVLKSSDLLATGTAYVESNVKKHLAMYNANTASTNDTIQLRDKSQSGIVSTISGGLIKKVKISWNTKTVDNRILNIYASNEKLSSTSDLYSGNKVKLIGTISNSKKETEFVITENYKYIGVNSSSGAIFLDSISFEWETIKPTVDEIILQSSYVFTEMTDGENISNGIRFVGSVKEDKFADLSSVGFNFTLTSTDKNVTKDYAIETTKLYNIIDDSNKFVFEHKEDETFTLDGYLSYSLILNNISETFNATITFYSYAIIDGVTYNSKTITINIVDGAKA